METYLFWDLLPKGVELDKSLVSAFEKLESNGWLARGTYGDHSIRFWPDGKRASQYTIDLRYPLNEHRYLLLERHTGISFTNERNTK